jgi:hypothetical protein
MCSSTETREAQGQFAADVLRGLLLHINEKNRDGREPFLVSHAWTEGAVMYLVYRAPPSDITWGLVRDTRESNIEPRPWPALDVAVRYYYLLDLYEGRVSASFRHPGDPDTILWHGDQNYGDPSEGLLPAPGRHPRDVPVYTAPHNPFGNTAGSLSGYGTAPVRRSAIEASSTTDRTSPIGAGSITSQQPG